VPSLERGRAQEANLPTALSFTATSTATPYSRAPFGNVSVLKDATANNDFTIDFTSVRDAIGTMRNREIHIQTNQAWTVTPVITNIETSLDGTNFASLKKCYAADETTAAAVFALTDGPTVDHVYTTIHDFKYLRIKTTGGKVPTSPDGLNIQIW
jgi:hypothetical protein